jgi:hypothetical protein
MAVVRMENLLDNIWAGSMGSKDLDELLAAVADAGHNSRGDMMVDNASVADVMVEKSQELVVVRNDNLVVELSHLLV